MNRHLWKIEKGRLKETNLAKYSNFIKKNCNVNLANNFDKIWQWSIDNPKIFWKSVWNFTGVKGYQGKNILQESKIKFKKRIKSGRRESNPHHQLGRLRFYH